MVPEPSDGSSPGGEGGGLGLPDREGPGEGVALAVLDDPGPRSRNPALVYLARLSRGSQASQRSALRVAASILAPELEIDAVPWHRLGYAHLVALRSRLADRLAPATANRILSAVQGVLREAERLGLMSRDDRARACDIGAVRGTRLTAGRMLPDAELRALFAVQAGEGTVAVRDRAALGLLYGAGLRRAELVALDAADVSLAPEAAAVRVHGKGNKERSVPLPTWCVPLVSAWLSIRGSEPGPLFVALRRNGKLTDRRFSDDAVVLLLQRRAAGAGVAATQPHNLRRTYVSRLLDEGVDVSSVQRLAGHASVTTTQRYDRRGERRLREAAGRLPEPS